MAPAGGLLNISKPLSYYIQKCNIFTILEADYLNIDQKI